MAIPSNVLCPVCNKLLVSFQIGDKEGLCKMVIKPNASAHESGIVCNGCGNNFLLDLDLNNPSGPARFILRKSWQILATDSALQF